MKTMLILLMVLCICITCKSEKSSFEMAIEERAAKEEEYFGPPSSYPKYAEYFTDEKRFSEQLSKLKSEFDRCFGAPLRYDARDKINTYASYQFSDHSNFRYMLSKIRDTRDAAQQF